MRADGKMTQGPSINMWGILLLIAAGFSGWGCAPTTINRMGLVVRPPVGTFKEIVIGQIKGAKFSPASQQNFTYKLHGKLMESGGFGNVTMASSNPKRRPSQVVLTGTITEFSEGNRFAQWVIGFGAGASEATGVFRLTDQNGKSLYQFSASTSYAGGMGIGGAPLLSMDDLLENLASSVAEEAAKWARGDPLEEEGGSDSQVADSSYRVPEVLQETSDYGEDPTASKTCASPSGCPGVPEFTGTPPSPKRYTLSTWEIEEKGRQLERNWRMAELLPRARKGDAQAQFDMAQLFADLTKRWRWICLAAHNKHARAQNWMAARHLAGIPKPVKKDNVRAYLWYGLSVSNGNREAERAMIKLAEQMSPEQIVGATRLIEEWTPKPGECGMEASGDA